MPGKHSKPGKSVDGKIVEIDLGGGRKIRATPVRFNPITEAWNEYRTSDGKMVKIRLVVTDIWRAEEADPHTGTTQYITRSQNIQKIEDAKG